MSEDMNDENAQFLGSLQLTSLKSVASLCQIWVSLAKMVLFFPNVSQYFKNKIKRFSQN